MGNPIIELKNSQISNSNSVEFQWRVKARLAAYIDLVLSILALLFTFVLVYFGIAYQNFVANDVDKFQDTEDHPDKETTEMAARIFLWILWSTIVAKGVLVFINLWAVCNLLKATKEAADPQKALHRARIWKNINIALLIFCILHFTFTGLNYASTISILFRLLLLIVVWKFIDELREVAKGSIFACHPAPAVIVKK